MGKDVSPQASKRTTRSSLNATTPNSKALQEARKASKLLQPLSIKDLVFCGESVNLDELINSFPGRRAQILELVKFLGPLNSPMIPLFIYGGPSTGKTSTTLYIFKHLKRPFIYCSCVSCYNPRILFESILNQLLLHRKNEGNGYLSSKKCDKPFCFISAFLATRNPATLDLFFYDASLFDATGGSGNRKSKRKVSEKSIDRKEAKEQEILMKGPGTFPLERLLAIYQCISSVGEYSLDDDEEQQNGGLGADGSDSGSMSDILLQLSSLCSANFITKGGSCPLEGSTRYRSIVSEDIALKVARSLKFPLLKYLYRDKQIRTSDLMPEVKVAEGNGGMKKLLLRRELLHPLTVNQCDLQIQTYDLHHLLRKF